MIRRHTSKGKFFGSLTVPFMLSIAIFLLTRSTFAQVIEGEINLDDYVTTNEVEIGVESLDGFSRVYYVFENTRQYVSEEGQNSRQPSVSGEYLTYVQDINGAGQVFLKNIVTGTLIQITNIGTNLNPDVSKSGNVVWEGWIPEDDTWQVFLFNGSSIRQLTNGDMSMNPDVENDKVIYSRRDMSGEWRAVLYSISENRHIDVITGENTRESALKDGKIFLANGKQEFELSADGLLTLNLTANLTSNIDLGSNVESETVTEEEIIDEVFGTAESDSEIPSSTPTLIPILTPSVDPSISGIPISSSSASLEE